jgi:two-component system sensor histidine kinase YesM
MESTGEYVHSYLLNPSRVVIRSEIPHTYTELHEQNDLEDFLKALKTVTQRGIFIITRSGYFYGENEINTDILKEQSWWKAIPSDYIGEYWAGFYTPKHYKEWNAKEKVLGLVVPIRNQQGALKDSRILIEMKADKLYEMFHIFEQNTQAMLTITNRSGQLMYQSPTSFQPKENDIVWTKSVGTSDWKIEARLPYKAFYQSSNVIRSYTFVGLGLSGLLALLLSYLFSARVTGRIKRLKESMFLAGKGRLQTRIPIQDKDELGVLAHSFNRMVGQIQDLVDEITVTEQLKKEAELRAFHYQINPHLLFNTLNSIQWKAKLQGNEDIRKMLYHLAMLLEGNLDITQELVTLRKELEVIDHFLHIQRIRYEHEFDYILEIEEHLMDYLIPRMSLQPLLENIFFHAFEDGNGQIRITVKEEGEELVLTLEDNGKGMTEASLEKMRSGTYQSKRGRGLGVNNVDQKFKLHFGPLYGLSIQSKEGQGTVITIRWPKKEGDEHDNEISD